MYLLFRQKKKKTKIYRSSDNIFRKRAYFIFSLRNTILNIDITPGYCYNLSGNYIKFWFGYNDFFEEIYNSIKSGIVQTW